uniref:G-protein coupled receptors family 1 profile domain-containing protein n=1 Tax=Mola mola TaxID=94237 RepID=A0A3Q3WN65_MOLML
MSANESARTAEVEYTCVRFYVSVGSFSLLLLFNILINSTIVRVENLRTHARFVLVFHLLLSALVYLGTSSVFHYQVYLHARPGRPACAAMVTVLISSGSNILLTLTVMALDRYCAVCHPMRYTARCAAWRAPWPWLLGALTWLVALAIPLSLLAQQDAADYRGECGPEQLHKGQLHKVLFIGSCTLVILYTYARILVEGRRLGVLHRRNRAGCSTIALHGSQLAVFILPNFVSFVLTRLHRRGLVDAHTKELSAVLIFAFFSLAQCVAPVIYGLRKEELAEQLSHQFPCCARHLKTTIISLEVPHSPEEEEEEEEEEEDETRPVPVRISPPQGDTDAA